MRSSKALGALLALALLGGSLGGAQALAAPGPATPAWSIQALAAPTNFTPGDESGLDTYQVFFTNSGAKATDRSPITITDTLPAGIGVKNVKIQSPGATIIDLGEPPCAHETTAAITTVTCVITEALEPAKEPALFYPDDALMVEIHVKVPPSASGTLLNQVTVSGGGAEEASAEGENPASSELASAGYEEFHAALREADGLPARGADSHPYEYTTSWGVNLVPAPPGAGQPFLPAGGDLREVEVTLPPGLAGNPTVTPRCTAQQFNALHGALSPRLGVTVQLNECPDGSAVGVVTIQQFEGSGGVIREALYNLVPPAGMPAQLGFEVVGLPVYINTKLRSDGDYGITAYVKDITQAKRVTALRVAVWGVPADPSHDPQRGSCALLGGSCPAELPSVRPFTRLPSSCDSPLTTAMSFDTWLHPGTLLGATASEAAPGECDKPDFSPRIESKPTTNVADAPSGLGFDLHLPQAENEDPEGLGEADLRETTVTLPAGLLVNPASANGLAGCSEAEVGYEGVREGRQSFSAAPANCPDAAKIGSVEVDTPLLDHPLPGAVYLARQGENPFGSLLAIYIAVNDPQTGVVVKLPAKVTPDPQTGRLTTTVTESPQLPFEDFRLHFFEGARAPLRTPATCGTHTTTTDLRPWTSPAFGADATPSDSFETTQGAGGGACPATPSGEPNAPSFEAGTAAPVAGAYSPFVLHLARQDGSQEIKGLNLTLPKGLSAKFAGATECSEAQIAQAQSREKPGRGALEQQSPSCPASSQLGTVTVGAGAGPAPFYAQGKAYLAGPYKGAPFSMAIVTPAVAGPFDLGAVVVRAGIYVDPETAQGTVRSDPVPAILNGIPLDIRSIAVKVDRNQFTLNPTSCEAKSVSGEAISVFNQVASLSNRFQVGGCSNLGFKPKLALALKGGTKRGGHPALTATLTYPAGAYANTASAQVALPHSEFLDQGHIGTVCTRVQFAAAQCPPKSVYGFVKATTPLLDQPLQGPVYLRSSSHQLPDLVADLNGQIHVVLDGRVDSVHGGIRTSFESTPDAPVSKVVLSMAGGRKGLLENSTDICRGAHRATAVFGAQNGRVSEFRPALRAKCGGRGKKRDKRNR